jgi:hypothetical protein
MDLSKSFYRNLLAAMLVGTVGLISALIIPRPTGLVIALVVLLIAQTGTAIIVWSLYKRLKHPPLPKNLPPLR